MVKLNSNLKGLVLAGGRSLRMGESKAKMRWHGKEQQYYLQKQHRSLRNILIEENVKTIKAPEAGALINVNTSEDAKIVYHILATKK